MIITAMLRKGKIGYCTNFLRLRDDDIVIVVIDAGKGPSGNAGTPRSEVLLMVDLIIIMGQRRFFSLPHFDQEMMDVHVQSREDELTDPGINMSDRKGSSDTTSKR